MLIGIRPDDSAYVGHTGADFHPQNESDTIPFYEITSTADEILFDLSDDAEQIDNPVMIARTAFGPTDFTITDRQSGDVVISEQSGFDTDVWFVDISQTSYKLKIADFDTDDGVDGTQAAWYPFLTVIGART